MGWGKGGVSLRNQKKGFVTRTETNIHRELLYFLICLQTQILDFLCTILRVIHTFLHFMIFLPFPFFNNPLDSSISLLHDMKTFDNAHAKLWFMLQFACKTQDARQQYRTVSKNDCNSLTLVLNACTIGENGFSSFV